LIVLALPPFVVLFIFDSTGIMSLFFNSTSDWLWTIARARLALAE